MGVWESGHILFAVFGRPFGCKIPPHYRANIIDAKKITLTDGRKRASRAPVHVRALYPFAVRPCARSRLSVRRCRSRSPTPPTHPTKTHTKHPPTMGENGHPRPLSGGGQNRRFLQSFPLIGGKRRKRKNTQKPPTSSRD